MPYPELHELHPLDYIRNARFVKYWVGQHDYWEHWMKPIWYTGLGSHGWWCIPRNSYRRRGRLTRYAMPKLPEVKT